VACKKEERTRGIPVMAEIHESAARAARGSVVEKTA
jgi:hypothetical protein